MKNRQQSNNAVLNVRVDHVESKLDETIVSFKDSLRETVESLKETIDKSGRRCLYGLEQLWQHL